MKKIAALLFALIFISSCNKSKDDGCIDTSLINQEVACFALYDPVCGCDGKTYGNSCEAKFMGGVKSFTEGACNCNYPYSGMVVEMLLDGCDKAIQLPDNSYLIPRNLPAGFQLTAGTSVEFDYTPNATVDVCMAGEAIDISCIRELGCRSIGDLDLNGLNLYYFDDEITIQRTEIQGDCLIVEVSFAGGCADHEFRLSEVPPTCATPPLPPIVLMLEHEANDDPCEALIAKKLSFDLTKIKEENSNQIDFVLITRNGGLNRSFVYSY